MIIYSEDGTHRVILLDNDTVCGPIDIRYIYDLNKEQVDYRFFITVLNEQRVYIDIKQVLNTPIIKLSFDEFSTLYDLFQPGN